MSVSEALHPDARQAVERMSAEMDLTFQSVINALIVGATHRGTLRDLIEHGIRHGVPERRRPTLDARARWTRIGEAMTERTATGFPLPAGRSHTYADGKGHTLTRLGRAGGAFRQPGSGWYLEGPGIDEPLFLGPKIRDAMLAASAAVDRLAES